jgi:putative glycerol kinase 5
MICAGLYPLVGWRLGKKTTFIAEASANDTATTLRWAQLIGLFESVETTSELAASVASSDGVAFVPAFGGLQVGKFILSMIK